MEGLPKLPGFTFHDITRERHNVPHNFDFVNGLPLVKNSQIGIGGAPLDVDSVLYAKKLDSVRYDPSLTYGRSKKYVPSEFKPHFVLYDKKCLAFRGFFKQSVPNSPDEAYRVRKIQIIYFLEDDTMLVTEPRVENAGFPQGRLVTRGRIMKNTGGEFYHWKDLNNGMDLTVNGIVYHVCSCDTFTREYLTSQGVDVNEDEPLPDDPYSERRKIESLSATYKTPTVTDKLYKYLAYGDKTLRFRARWDDEENGHFGQYNIIYFLADEKIEVVEVLEGNSGKDPFALLLSKRKVPKNWRSEPPDFPAIYMEKTENDIDEFYTPSDFIIGNTLFIYGRRFLLCDCDNFTREFYRSVYNVEQPPSIVIKEEERPIPLRPMPRYTGLGTVEDSIQSWYSFNPAPPKKDAIRYLLNMSKKLRYMAIMDAVRQEDKCREFIIEYRLSDGFACVNELKKRNTGFEGGRFLSYQLVPKPGTDQNNPEYYTPTDFTLGAILNFYGHRFIITGVDLAVYRYMETNPEKFNPNIVNDVRKHLVREGLLTEDVKDIADFRKREEIDEPHFSAPFPDAQQLSVRDLPKPNKTISSCFPDEFKRL